MAALSPATDLTRRLEVLHLRRQGKSYREIRSETGRSLGWISKVLHARWEVDGRIQHEPPYDPEDVRDAVPEHLEDVPLRTGAEHDDRTTDDETSSPTSSDPDERRPHGSDGVTGGERTDVDLGTPDVDDGGADQDDGEDVDEALEDGVDDPDELTIDLDLL